MKRLVILFCIFLGVVSVGSVSAFTKVKEKEMKNQFRNIYTFYSNVLQKTVMEMSESTGCYYSASGEADVSGCDEFYRNFISNMKIKKYCHGKGLEKGCVASYKSYTTKPECVGFSKTMIDNKNDVFVLDNGSSIIVFNTESAKRTPFFAVDVNGPKPPNNAGEDLFTMLIMKNEGGSYYFHTNITYCLPVEKGGIENIQDLYK